MGRKDPIILTSKIRLNCPRYDPSSDVELIKNKIELCPFDLYRNIFVLIICDLGAVPNKDRVKIIIFQLAAKYKEMKKSASDAMNLVKKQQEGGNSEVEELRNENEKLSQQIEDLNLQLLQQHIAKERFSLNDVIVDVMMTSSVIS